MVRKSQERYRIFMSGNFVQANIHLCMKIALLKRYFEKIVGQFCISREVRKKCNLIFQLTIERNCKKKRTSSRTQTN